MPSYAEWVSTSALALSALNFTWHVSRARRDRPAVSVDGRPALRWQRESDAGSDGAWLLDISVTNAGGRAVTVKEVYWELNGPAGTISVSSEELSTSFPLRLESLSTETISCWVPLQAAWIGRSARPAADVVMGKGIVTVRGPSNPLPPSPWQPDLDQ